MHRPPRAASAHASGSRRLRFWAAAVSAGLAGVALAALAGIAIAKATTLGVAKNVKVATKTESIVVDSNGLTVYTLSSDTVNTRHCTNSNGCFGFWPPVTVSSSHVKLTAAAGVKGKLGITHKFGVFQVTLGSHPLYRFKPDNKTKGKAAGDGIPGLFGGGGTWHVVKASTTTHASTHTTTTTTTTPTNPYHY